MNPMCDQSQQVYWKAQPQKTDSFADLFSSSTCWLKYNEGEKIMTESFEFLGESFLKFVLKLWRGTSTIGSGIYSGSSNSYASERNAMIHTWKIIYNNDVSNLQYFYKCTNQSITTQLDGFYNAVK